MKKLLTWGLVALGIWWAVKDPGAAAHLVHAVGGAFSHAAASLSTITGSD